MTERTHRERETDIEYVQDVYRTGQNLDAKYEVRRQYGVSPESFDEWLLQQLPIEGRERILDVGCGQGRFLLPLAASARGRGGCVVGYDISEGVMSTPKVVVAEQHLPAALVVGDAQHLPFPEGHFDVVMANHMLYHVPDILLALQEARRVLKPGGLFVATTNSDRGMPEFFSLHAQTMSELGIPFEPNTNELTFSVENGAAKLGQVFDDVRALTYDGGFRVSDPGPVLKYYVATQLFQGPSEDPSIPAAKSSIIGETFSELTAQAIDRQGGTLLISKPEGAFVCRKDAPRGG